MDQDTHSENVLRQKRKTAAPAVVLAMHGAPPRDFPEAELAEFFALHTRAGHGDAGPESPGARLEELEARLRRWPRTADNDPFFAGSIELAGQLRRASGLDVILGFNEFCSPSLPEALDMAARAARKVLIITPMMTRGGEHSAVDIPAAVRAARQRHPGKEFVYVWPFPVEDIARFLAGQISRCL